RCRRRRRSPTTAAPGTSAATFGAAPSAASTSRTPGRPTSWLLLEGLLQFHRQGRNHLVKIAYDAVGSDLEDRGVLVLVDRDDRARGRHPGEMLDGARDADREVEGRVHDLARLTDLVTMVDPSGVHRGARGPERGAEDLAQLSQELEILWSAHRAASAHDHVRLGEVGDFALGGLERDDVRAGLHVAQRD